MNTRNKPFLGRYYIRDNDDRNRIASQGAFRATSYKSGTFLFIVLVFFFSSGAGRWRANKSQQAVRGGVMDATFCSKLAVYVSSWAG